MEQRHADQLRLVQEVAQADRDQLVSQLQRDLDKRQQQLHQTKEEESRLKESMQTMSEVKKQNNDARRQGRQSNSKRLSGSAI